MSDLTELLKEAIIIDGACPLANVGNHWERWIEGRATAIAVTVATNDSIESTMHKIGSWFKKFRKYPNKLLHITSVEDIYRAKREKKLGIIFHFQNTLPFGTDLNMIEVYHKLGVRIVQLCYNVKNFVGDGCSERTDCGLSEFGIKVISEMNRLGIVVDLSHCGYRTSMEAIEVSKDPVIFSHSNVRAICDSPRNLTDDQIIAVASKGGTIGINGFPAFVAKKPKPTLDDLLKHVDYIAELVGTKHIAIGMDYWEGMAGISSEEDARALYDSLIESGSWNPKDYPPPPWYYPEGIEVPNKLYRLAEALLDRGYSKQDVKNILGENLIRVFKRVWK